MCLSDLFFSPLQRAFFKKKKRGERDKIQKKTQFFFLFFFWDEEGGEEHKKKKASKTREREREREENPPDPVSEISFFVFLPSLLLSLILFDSFFLENKAEKEERESESR